MFRGVAVVGLAIACGGCVTGESVRFQARAQQEALVRDGNQALVSRKKSSIVIIKPASRQFASGARPVFVVGINNLTNAPLQFRVSNIDVVQNVGTTSVPLKVVTYEELVTEEKNRQIFAAVVTGLAAGANAAAASQQGRYSSTSTVYGPRGTYNVHTTGYSPVANAIAQDRAAAQNDAMISATIERGQQNMAALEQGVIKDNTLLAGEWYGGQLHLSPLAEASANGAKSYVVSILVGSERHDIEIVQAAAT